MGTGDELLVEVHRIIHNGRDDQPGISVRFVCSIVKLCNGGLVRVRIAILPQITRAQAGCEHLEVASRWWFATTGSGCFPGRCRIPLERRGAGWRLIFAEMKEASLL